MARCTASIETPRPPAETFAYLSDFSTTEEWNPGVVEAQRLGDAPVGEGTEFRLVADFLGRKVARRMARGVGTDAARARTITVYTDVAKAVRELGLPGTDTIGVLLVDRSGRILAREHGGLDDDKPMRLTAALERSTKDA